jgi:hypothetical protein
MLKKLLGIVILMSFWLGYPKTGLTVEHPPEHGGGGGSGGARGCPKVGVRNIKPAPLSEVAAGSAFSALVVGADNADGLEVSVKKIPIPATVTAKDNFLLVSGHLPADLTQTAARINIKVKGKLPGCVEENGWLLKITD